MSVFPRKNSKKTQSSLNFLQSGPRKFTNIWFFGIGPDPADSERRKAAKADARVSESTTPLRVGSSLGATGGCPGTSTRLLSSGSYNRLQLQRPLRLLNTLNHIYEGRGLKVCFSSLRRGPRMGSWIRRG